MRKDQFVHASRVSLARRSTSLSERVSTVGRREVRCEQVRKARLVDDLL